MPQQFEYPEQGWSTGNMRKVGDGANPTLPMQDWQDWTQGTLWGFKADPEEKGATVGTYATPKHDLGPFLRQRPEGFVTDHNHPGLKDIKNDADIYSIPQSGFEDKVFVRPKGPLVSKMLPTTGQAVQVLEQAAGRQRGKRKEAEAM